MLQAHRLEKYRHKVFCVMQIMSWVRCKKRVNAKIALPRVNKKSFSINLSAFRFKVDDDWNLWTYQGNYFLLFCICGEDRTRYETREPEIVLINGEIIEITQVL